ncbi:MAG: hypothetical protein HY717_10850 [Planctomycetes bacterium]|nr:hypothetical protein [Planctomycetota bacterium]
MVHASRSVFQLGHFHHCRPFLVLAFWAAAARPGAADSLLKAPRGFGTKDFIHLSPNQILGGLAYAPDGSKLYYDGVSVRRHSNGEDEKVLFTPPIGSGDRPIFGSFLEVIPDGSAVIFGENTRGNLYRIPLTGDGAGPAGDLKPVDYLSFNFDMSFNGKGQGLVSALSKVKGNSIVLFDGDPAQDNDAIVDEIPQYSGPLAFDGADNLYYATARFDGLPNQLWRFTAAQVESAIGVGVLGPQDAEVLLADIPNKIDMVFAGRELYLADPNLGTIDRLVEGGLETFARIEVPGGVFFSATFLAFRPGLKEFSPGAGASGGALAANLTDFQRFNDLAEVTPELFFQRGRINADGEVDISDAIALLRYAYLGGPAPDPLEAGDVNDDGGIDGSDAVYLLEYLFIGGPRPPEPFVEAGPDPAA